MDSLRQTLSSLTQLTVPDALSWEVIVVDNASTDQTQLVLDEFQGRLPLKTVREHKPGLSRARNAGVAASSGRFILMTDDDCRLAANWLTRACDLLRTGPLQLIGGRVELHDAADLPLAIRTAPDREVLTSYSSLWGFIHGANMVFPRELIDRIGLFDARLGAGSTTRSAEDADFVYRALTASIPVIYEPTLLVYHAHGRRGADAWYGQIGDHAIGMGAMAMKYALQGDFAPTRIIYWDFASTLAMWRRDRREWRRAAAKTQALRGALRFATIYRQPSV